MWRALPWFLVLAASCCRTERAREASVVLAVASPPTVPVSRPLPSSRSVGQLETVATFEGPMPTGVTVARGGRIFVCFPRWGDPVAFTVAELKGGVPVAFPDIYTNALRDGPDASHFFVSVQSVVVDPRDRLWALDTGSVEMGPPRAGGAKLVAIDLLTNRVTRTITFPPTVALPTSYLNDVRFDLRRGGEGVAYITDSSARGSNAIIVVDLATGTSQRRLVDHPSVRAEPGFQAFVEGHPIALNVGVDGLALSPDGSLLYYAPLASRRLYAVPTDDLVDPTRLDAEVGDQVQDLGEKGASDGLEADTRGRVYATLYEHQAVVRRLADGRLETVISDPRLLWPDTLALADDGHLYVIANQLHREARFRGVDQRVRPFALFRVRTDGRWIHDDLGPRTTMLEPPP